MVSRIFKRPSAAFTQSIKLSHPFTIFISKFKTAPTSYTRDFLIYEELSCSFDILLKTRPIPTISSFNQLFDLANKKKQYNLVISMHNRMVKDNIVTDFYTLNILLHSFCTLKRVHSGFSVLGLMVKKGYDLDINIRTYTSLVKGLFLAGKETDAMNLSEKIVKMGAVSYGTLVEGLCQTGNTELALQLYHEMESSGKLIPDIHVYNALMYGLCKNGKVDEAEQMFVSMESGGHEGDTITYSLLIIGYCKSGQPDEAIRLYRKMFHKGVQREAFMYNAILVCLRKNKELKKVKSFINEMMCLDIRSNESEQDFLQTMSEASLPDNVLAVPLLAHQGLGKTLSTIALILKERSPVSSHSRSVLGRPYGGTLVVCPLVVLNQWANELDNKVTHETNLSVLVYHGIDRTKDPCELAKYDIVLTTYPIVKNEVQYQTSDGKTDKNMSGPLDRVEWFRVVLDEAHTIKNHKAQVARACWGLHAKRRWCLSGTPLQNYVDDLYSYIRFLRYDQYDSYRSFCSSIKVPNGYKKLLAILKTMMLRRTKDTILDGKPIVKLPPKTVELKKLDFTTKERDFYRRLETGSRALFSDFVAAGAVKKEYFHILTMIIRLRQACNHPLLAGSYKSSPAFSSSVKMAKKLPPTMRISLLNCLEASLTTCGICNDPPEDAVVTGCGHVFCNQCIREHLISGSKECPAANCKSRARASMLFSRASLKCSFSEVSDKVESSSWDPPFVSSKIKAVLEVLESLSEQKSTVEKALVFSQWLGMLDLLEPSLKSSSIQYRRLDGTMSKLAREKAMHDFKSLPEVKVMIMSLKACGHGINMVEGSHVILIDPWWNPAVEDQAVDRAHRIGQTRPVSVLRLTVEDTIEDRVLALQEKKREMVATVFGSDQMNSHKTSLTEEDLKYLFDA